MPSTSVIAAQTLSISSALVASGAVATLSIFDIPMLQSQPASRSLPSVRWLFSRGSHIFPTASVVTTAGFTYLAYSAIPQSSATASLAQLLRRAMSSGRVGGYLAAATLCFSIAPWTALVMIPTNFRLIQLNEDLGGTRSQNSANQENKQPGGLTAEQSVDNKDQPNQLSDLSGPQTVTTSQSTPEQDREARELLSKFSQLNMVRSMLMGASGIVGLVIALAG